MALPFMSRKTSDNEGLHSYPLNRTSIPSESPIVRSRTWSEDITKTWNVPITGLESLPERVERYCVYFLLTTEQLRLIMSKFRSQMQLGLELHMQNPKRGWDVAKCSLKMIDTYVCESSVPNSTEKGSAIALDFGGLDAAQVRAVKVVLEGEGRIATSATSLELRDASLEFPKGLLDRNATASLLFDSLAGVVQEVVKAKGFEILGDKIPVGFSICFPVEQRALDSASLMHWTKGYETGRKSNDPVEGMDVAAFLDCAFWRLQVPAKTKAVINDTTGVLLTCSYEKPSHLPKCRVGFVLGAGVNGCYIQPDASQFGYRGDVINCELGSFDKSLPVNDVDLEVDFADEATKGIQLFEKMVSTTYLGELCRRLVVKVWQNEAPQLAWVRFSMPWVACARVIEDEEENLSITNDILDGLWSWKTTVEERRTVQRLFVAVFDRSAALSAVAIIALASQTERLQAAMGGLTCAIGGTLMSKFPWYFEKVRNYMNLIREDTASLISLYQVQDGSAKGAGILAAIVSK